MWSSLDWVNVCIWSLGEDGHYLMSYLMVHSLNILKPVILLHSISIQLLTVICYCAQMILIEPPPSIILPLEHSWIGIILVHGPYFWIFTWCDLSTNYPASWSNSPVVLFFGFLVWSWAWVCSMGCKSDPKVHWEFTDSWVFMFDLDYACTIVIWSFIHSLLAFALLWSGWWIWSRFHHNTSYGVFVF